MEVATALCDAEALILKHGWRKKSFGSKKDGFCLLGALRHVVFGPSMEEITITDEQWNVFLKSVTALHHVMMKAYPNEAKKSVAMWNDMRGRTKKHVLTLLRSAIAAATTTP